jgi:hypothetical protein
LTAGRCKCGPPFTISLISGASACSGELDRRSARAMVVTSHLNKFVSAKFVSAKFVKIWSGSTLA